MQEYHKSNWSKVRYWYGTLIDSKPIITDKTQVTNVADAKPNKRDDIIVYAFHPKKFNQLMACLSISTNRIG